MGRFGRPGVKVNAVPEHITRSTVYRPTSSRVLVIGAAVDGPDNGVMMEFSNPADLVQVFGPTKKSYAYQDGPGTAYTSLQAENDSSPVFNGNTLVLKATEALRGGASSVVCLRIATGTRASATLKAGAADALTFTAINAGTVYNAAGSYADQAALDADGNRRGVWISSLLDTNTVASATAGDTTITLTNALPDWVEEGDVLTITQGSAVSTYARILSIDATRKIVTIAGGAADNYSSATAYVAVLKFNLPGVKGGGIYRFAYNYYDSDATSGYTTYRELMARIREHPVLDRIVSVELDSSIDSDAGVALDHMDPTDSSPVLMSGGTNGTINEFTDASSKAGDPDFYVNAYGYREPDDKIMENFYTAYQNIQQYLAGIPVDLIVFADAVADIDATSGSFVNLLADTCAVQLYRGYYSHGIIGTKILKNPTLAANVASYVEELTGYSGSNPLASVASGSLTSQFGSGSIMSGKLVSVYVGPDLAVNLAPLGMVATNGAALYAGMLSTLAINETGTNKPLPAGATLYEFTAAQLDALCYGQPSRNGTVQDASGPSYVTAHTRNGVVYITDAVTFAQQGSDYQSFFVTHLAQVIIRRVTDVVNGMLGGVGSALNNNTATVLKTQIEMNVMDQLALAGALADTVGAYEVTVSADQRSFQQGIVNIYIKFMPASVLRYVLLSLEATKGEGLTGVKMS